MTPSPSLMRLLFLFVGFVSLAHAQPLPTEVAFPDLQFTLPTDIQHAGDGSNRLFVAEQPGRILVFPNDPATTQAAVFLNITEQVLVDSRFGFLGFAFHPDYATNGQVYVHYTTANPDRSVISRFTVSDDDPDALDPESELVLLEVDQPHNFHNGGALAFGPDDGYLYIPLGDGGPGNDPNGEGQDRTTLLGSVLRIDVDNTSGNLNYSIPPDNPFVGNTEGWREEIWAWGFRNPWRIAFDPVTGLLWTGENGEDRRDEIDLIELGKNYGWSTMEGSLCFSPMAGCATDGLALPIYEYADGPRRSVIGGLVYRGTRNPELAGRYIFGDFLLGTVWALDGTESPVRTELASDLAALTTFGTDEQGELYFASASTGQLLRFVPTATSTEEAASHPPAAFLAAFPNPTHGEDVRLTFRIARTASVRLTVYDILGRRVALAANATFSAGLHTVTWEPGTQASGTYLFRMEMEEYAATRTIHLVH